MVDTVILAASLMSCWLLWQPIAVFFTMFNCSLFTQKHFAFARNIRYVMLCYVHMFMVFSNAQ